METTLENREIRLIKNAKRNIKKDNQRKIKKQRKHKETEKTFITIEAGEYLYKPMYSLTPLRTHSYIHA